MNERDRVDWWVAAVFLAVVLVIGAGVGALIHGTGAGDRDDTVGRATAMAGATTVDLASLPAETAGLYRFAATHPTEFAMIPCYCGCHQTLAHRNLEDCFVRADGTGWDAHASGCAVCTKEAATARELLAAGRSAAQVRAAVIEEYGPPPVPLAT